MRILFFVLFGTFSFLSYSQSEEASKKAEALLNEGAEFYYKQDYVKALKRSKDALSISLSNNDEYHLALSYNFIGTIYNEFSQTKRALDFYTKGLVYANKLENDTLKLWINSNIGNVYYYNDIDIEEGIRYYDKSLRLAEKLQDSLQITFIRINIANVYFEIDKREVGMAYVEPLSKYIDREGNTEIKIRYYDLIGRYNSLNGNNREAELYFFKGLNLAKKYNLTEHIHEAYKNLSQYYLIIDNLKESERYRKLAKSFEVDLSSAQKLDTIEQVALQIELDEYKFQFERIELKNELQNQKIREGRIVLIAFCIILVIFLILIYNLYSNNKTKKRSNTVLFEKNQELTEAKNQAEQSSVLKSQFISTVSHELRTPLYGVIGLTNIILEENKELISKDNLNSLRFSAHYLLALVNDLLEINKAEEKKITLNTFPFDLNAQLEIIKNSLTFMAEGNGNELLVHVDSAIPKTLFGDEIRLSQILINLISNALKFTQAGLVEVEINLLSKDEVNCELEFKVRDNGIGIKEEDLERIFESFVQIERKHGDYQGTGLGLPIVKKLVALFGATITVESEYKKGTVFTFRIIFGYSNTPQKLDTIERTDFSMENTLHFLVVEDNMINQVVTRKILERKNYECTIVESGYKALDLLKTTNFDVILMDINMPEIDGYETSKLIREAGILTPIIALTAFERSEVESKIKEAGISEVIIKPFSSEILFEVIEKLLQKN